jgi:hypothetical protein
MFYNGKKHLKSCFTLFKKRERAMRGKIKIRSNMKTLIILFISIVFSGSLLHAQVLEGDYVSKRAAGDSLVAVLEGVDEYPDSLNQSLRRWLIDRAEEDFKLLPSDGDTLDHFGYSVAISGDAMVIGAYTDDDSASESGSAYIFRNNGTTWVEEAKLTASDADSSDQFGRSVALSGDVVLIGAYADSDTLISEYGSAYIFRYDGSLWVEEAKLTASDADSSDHFGWSVAISGDVAVIGSYADSDTLIDEYGSVYIFRYDGSSWVEEAKLTASDADTSDHFGWSVAVEGDVVIAGAYADDDSGSESGSAYVFRYDGLSWIEDEKLVASDADTSDYFGRSVAVSGDVVIIGAEGNDGRITDTGSAYVFRYDGTMWIEEAKLYALDGRADDLFGSSVSLSGDVAIIGSYRNIFLGTESGQTYLFHYDGTRWEETTIMYTSDGDSLDFFGQTVSISGGVAVIGAYQDDDNGDNSGSAYVFETGRYFDKEEKKLASDGKGSDNFGLAVSVSGDVALIGAEGDNDLGADAGTAFIFRHDGKSWVEEAKLIAPDGDSYDRFGGSVSVSGDVAVAGAIYDDDLGPQSGSAYIFRYSGSSWIVDIKLLASDGDTLDSFGYSVAVSGDVVVVGASLDDDQGENSGSAYVYRYDGTFWTEETKLIPSDGSAGDYFGYHVSVFGDVVVISSVHDNNFEPNSGSAYIFRYDGTSWVEEARINASDGETGDFFGHSLSIWGDAVIIGAYADDDSGSESGSAYVFRYDGSAWNEEAKLHASDEVASDRFGYSVSLWGDAAVIGAYGDDDEGLWAGSAYIFRNDGNSWVEVEKILAADGQPEDWFGRCVALSGDVAVIGAPGDDDKGDEAGSVYMFSLFGD